jgi:hypothetical protein
MHAFYALLIHVVVMLCSFNFSVWLLDRRRPRKGEISSLAVGIAFVTIGVGYFLFRAPRVFFASTSVYQSDNVAAYYILGGAIFLAHFSFLAFRRSQSSEPNPLDPEFRNQSSRKEEPNQPSEPIPLKRDGSP